MASKPKNKGFSKDPRIRARQQKTIEAYAENADWIGSDPERDRLAKIEAIDRSGNRRLQRDEAKVKWFNRLWKSDEAREYMRSLWAMEVEEMPNPVALIMRRTYENMEQPVETCTGCDGTGVKEVRDGESFIACPACRGAGKRSDWGPRDRGHSIAATNAAMRMFIPQQTAVSKSLTVSAKIERPEQFEQEPQMQSRTILPAGQKITKPTPPTGESDDEEDDDDNDDDE